MIKIKFLSAFALLFFSFLCYSQKILFDATKAETAGNADWVIDSDNFNLKYSGSTVSLGGNESNPQRYPTPDQSTVTSSTPGTYWTGGLSSWGIDCVKQGYHVETLPYNGLITYGNISNPQDLSNYTVFIVCEPNIPFTALEKTAILNFVKDGGGLFMISDHTISDRNNDGWDSPAIWNDLLTTNSVQTNPFGISFDLSNISQTTSNIASLPLDSTLHGKMGNVTQAMWSNGTTMTLDKTKNPTVEGLIYSTGSSTTGTTNVMFATAKYGNGKVAAIGDSSPCDDGTGDTSDGLYDGYIADANGNHQKLLMNATIWLASHNHLLSEVNAPFSVPLNFTVYPNPVMDKTLRFSFTSENTDVPAQLDLFDMTGLKVRMHLIPSINTNIHNQNIDLHGLTMGVYLCKLIKGNLNAVQRIVIAK